MTDSAQDALIPESARRILSLSLTVIAALLYAVVLGTAVIRTVLEENPVFPQNMVRAAGLLSGLVGSVVTAGFATSPRPGTVQLVAEHPLGGRARTGWMSLTSPSLIRRNLLGLASVLGLISPPEPTRSVSDELELPVETEPPAMESKMPTAAWVALLYFAVYFFVGVCAFLVAVWKDPVPEFVASSGWVWLGTAISAAYAFLGLNARD
ncbi:MAG: hypothetical protein FJZ90_11860 [Chloroflexi bacterium]|nr:hypothetical protein [Chloroflexota bacterium]